MNAIVASSSRKTDLATSAKSSRRASLLASTALVAGITLGGPALGQTWDGEGTAGNATTDSWNVGLNWDGDNVPLATGAVIIQGTAPSGTTAVHQPRMVGINQNVASVVISSGGQLHIHGNATLTSPTIALSGAAGLFLYDTNSAVSGDVASVAGTTISSSGVFDGNLSSGGTSTLAAGSVSGNLTVTGGATGLSGSVGVTGNVIVSDGVLTNHSSGTIGGNITISGNGEFINGGAGTPVPNMNDAGTLTVQDTGTFTGNRADLVGTIIQSGGTITQSGTLNANSMTHSGGTFATDTQVANLRLNTGAATYTMSGTAEIGRLGVVQATNVELQAGVIAGDVVGGTNPALDDGTETVLVNTGTTEVTNTGSIVAGTINVQASGTLQTAGGALLGHRSTATDRTNLIVDGALESSGNETVADLSGSGTIAMTGGTLTVAGGGTTAFSGNISGTGGVTVSKSAGVLTLSGTNTHQGATTLTAGGLTLLGGAAIANTGAVVVNGGTLAVDASETIGAFSGTGGGATIAAGQTLTTNAADTAARSFAGTLGGAGTFTKGGTDDLTLGGVVSVANVGVTGGTLELSNTGNTMTAISINGGELEIGASGTTNSAAITTGATATVEVIGSVTNNSAITATTDTALTIEAAGTATLSGAITTGAGGSLTRSGAGTVNLTGANAIGTLNANAGTTSVTNGALTTAAVNGGNLTIGGAATGLTTATINNGTLTLNAGVGGLTSVQVGDGTAGPGTDRLIIGTALNNGTTITTQGSVIEYLADSAALINLTSNDTQLQVDAGPARTQSGVISDDVGGVRPLEKIGAGELILSADNTYGNSGVGAAQGTTVTAGRLTITGSIDSNTVFVATGAGLTLGSVSASADGAVKDDAAIILDGAADLTLTQSETIGTITAATGTSTVQLGGNALTVAGAGNSAVAGTISGVGGALTKTGAGTLTLSGTNTYNGDTTITGGTVAINNDAALGAGDLVLNGGRLLATSNATVTKTNISIDGSSTLAASTLQTLSLSATNLDFSHAAPTTVTFGSGTETGVVEIAATTSISSSPSTLSANIAGGTLRIGNAFTGNGLLSFDFDGTNIASGGTLDINGNATSVVNLTGTGTVTNSGAAGTLNTLGTTNFGGVIQDGGGALSLAVTGGTTTLTGANTYTGTTTLSGGNLTLSGTGALTSTDVTINATQTLTTQGGLATGTVLVNDGALVLTGNDTIGSLDGTGTVDLSTRTLTTGGLNTDTALSGAVSGAGSLIKVGTGTQTLSGTNTATNLTVQDGTLRLNGDNAGVATVTVGGGVGTARLRVEGAAGFVGGQQITTLGSDISYGDNVNMATPIVLNSNDTRLEVLGADTAQQSGEISQTGGARPIEKIGSGTLTLSATNTYTGLTDISGGTLNVTGSIASTQIVAQNDARLIVDGASLADTASVSLAGTSNLTVNTAVETIGRLAGVAGTTVTLNEGLTFGDATDTEITSVITGAGDMTKQGTSTVTISGTSAAATGALTVNAGTIALTGAIGSTDVNVNTNGTLNVTNGGLAAAATVDVAGGTLDVSTAADTVATVNLNNNGTISGNATLNTSNFTQNTGTLSGTVSAATTASLQGGSISGTLTGAAAAEATAGTTSVTGAITSSDLNITGATVTVTGAGVIDVSGADPIDINAGGILTTDGATGGGGIADDDGVRMTGTAIFNVEGDETIAAIDGTGTVNLTAANLTTSGNFSTVFNGVMQGTGGLNTSGNNALELTGTNLYTGATGVNGNSTLTLTGSIDSALVTVSNAGELILDNGDALLDTAAVVLNDTGTMTLANVNSETIGSLAGAAGSTLALNGNTLTVGDATATTTMAGQITGTGGITKVGSGILNLTGTTSNYTGTTTITDGTLAIDNANALGAAAGSVVLNGGTLLGTANTVLTKADFTLLADSTIAAATGTSLTLAGNATITGVGTTLTIGNAGNAGTVVAAPTGGVSDGTAQVSIVNGTLQIGNAAAGALLLSGIAGTNIAGPGFLDLNGTDTTVNALTGPGGVINSGGAAALRTTGTSTFDGVIAAGPTGPTSLEVMGGALTLTEAQAYTGATTLAGGNLTLTGNGALVSTSVALGANTLSTDGGALDTATAMTSAGGTLALTGAEEIASFNGSGFVTLTGATTDLTLNTGASVVDAVISGAGGVTVTGTSDTTLNGNNTFAGGLSVSGAANATVNGPNSFAGGVSVTGTASATINAPSAYTGGTVINTTGTVTANGSLGATTGNTTLTNGVLDVIADTTQAIVTQDAGSITGGGTLTAATSFTQGGGVVAGTVTTPVYNMTNGTISNTGLVTATSTATLNDANSINGTLAGDRVANGTGATTIATGTTTIGATGAITNMASVTVDAGATLATGGNDQIDDLAEITLDGTLTLGGNETLLGLNGAGTGVVNTAGSNLTVNTPSNDLFAGQINGTGSFTVAGGEQTLTGANGFTGAATVSGGVLNVDGAGTLASTVLNITGGTLSTDGGALAAAAVVTNAGTLDISGDETIASVSGAGGITLDGGDLTLLSGTSSISGIIAGSGGLNVNGSSDTTLSGLNTYSGDTTINTTGGLTVAAGGSLGDTAANTTLTNGTLTIDTAVTQATVTQDGGLIDGGDVLTATDFIQTAGSVAGSVKAETVTMTDGTIDLGGLITATDTAVLNGTNSINGTLAGDRVANGTGATTIAGGTTTIGAFGSITDMASVDVDTGATLATGGNDQIDNLALITVDGTLNLGGDEVLSGLNGAGAVNNGGNALTLGTTGGTFSGVIADAGTLEVTGGTQVLTGANTYSGATTVSGGELAVNGAGTLASTVLNITGGTLSTDGGALAAAAAVTNAGTLDISGNEAVASVSGAGGITLDGGNLTLLSGGSTISGIITGSGGLNVNGGSTTTLSGANNYAGDTTVNGLLTVTGEIAGATTVSGSGTMTNNGVVADVTNAGSFTNTGTAGAVTNTGTGDNSGTIASLAQNAVGFVNSGTITGDADVTDGTLTHSGSIGGALNVGVNGTADVNGGSVTGATTNAGGVLNIDGGTFTGGVANNTGVLTATGAVTGNITNAATMLVTAPDNLALTGSITNTATLTTTGTISTSGGLTNSGSVNAQGALNSAVTNTAAFNVLGPLTATGQSFANMANLNIGANSYTGIGTLTNGGAGVVDLAAGGTLGTTTLTNNGIVNANGATVSGAMTNNATFNAQGATLSGSVNNSTTGVFDLTGGALTGPATNAGTFILTNGSVSGVFTNTGTATVAQPFLGLTALGNTSLGGLTGGGTVSLLTPELPSGPDFANATTDRMVINGNLSNTNFVLDLNMGSPLATDGGGALINPNGGTSDLVTVTGAISGTLNFDFQNKLPNGVAPYLGTPIKVLDGNVPSSYSFTYSGLGAGGAVIYSLAQNGDDLEIVSQTSAGIGGVAANASLVQSLIGTVVNRPTSPFVSGLASEEGCSHGGYFRGTYGNSTVSGTSNNGVSTSESSVRAKYFGVQGGYDFGCNDGRFFDGWDGSFGAMIGYNKGSSDQDVSIGVSGGGTAVASVTHSDFDQKYVGAYAAFSKDRITADVQVRVEKSDFTLSETVNPGFFGLGLSAAKSKFSTNSVNVTGRLSYRMDLNDDGLNFVPTGGLSYTRTSAATVNFDNGETLRIEGFNSIVGFVGGTIAKTIIAPAGNAGTTYFGSANYYHDFASDRKSVFTDRLGGTQTITTKNIGGFGELSMGVNYVRILEGGGAGAKQLNANVRLDTRFGSNVKKSSSVTAQIRLSF
ncbi:autotransporter-associated beta strand repeat-containing protein [Pseudorhodobacter sp. E13]|uniref:autotransporter-associated beta strand repeat-containing protein n=1 Tax=Pseudorhodobacter sp. E13 TaxID=2487931 RepID=UPI000F8F2089|nr:autotransporter-associated beta strand repeat-containing protein [Pseudorhodobacter sp. E13]